MNNENNNIKFSKFFDHAVLSPNYTIEKLNKECRLASFCDVASVCIVPYYVRQCNEILSGTSVVTSTVIGFPHGVSSTSIKMEEAKEALLNGCREIDVVNNTSLALSNKWDLIEEEIGLLTEFVHDKKSKIKIIFENCYLEDTHKITLCKICSNTRVDWVKTSTGYGSSGASEKDIILMKNNIFNGVQIKSSGRIKNLEQAMKFIGLGVTRIGTSRTSEIIDEYVSSRNMDIQYC